MPYSISHFAIPIPFTKKMLTHPNHFSLFNMPVSFFIDKKKLKNRYYTQAKLYHPSINTNGDEKFLSIKKAYDTLNNDLLRADYLYKHTHSITDKMKENTKPCNGSFLSDVLHLSERISNNDRSAIQELNERIDQCKERYYDPEYIKRWKYYEKIKERI